MTRTVVVKRTPLDIPLLLFLGSAGLSTVFAENVNVALFGTYERYDGLLTLLTYVALFWLSVQSLADTAEATVLIRVVLSSGYVVSAVAIVQSVHDTVAQGGIQTAFGSMGNPNVLGAFLALVFALTTAELLVARSGAARLALANVMVVVSVALLLSFSRSSWLGAVVGVGFAFVLRPRLGTARYFVPAASLVIAILVLGYVTSSPGQLERALVDRAFSSLDPKALQHTRLGIWGDSLRMVASRPVTGYGPDNVGLVFPRFQTGDWGALPGVARQPVDKAHAELLQVAATQGVIGVAIYLFLQLAFLRSVWRARGLDAAAAAGAGWIAYLVVVQLNFTALAAALPFWIFAAAAITSCEAVRPASAALRVERGPWLLVPGVALAAAMVGWGAVAPYWADATLRQAVDADYSGHPLDAQRLAAEARQLGPQESVYAVEVGNVAFEQDHWAPAREAYRDAARLGTFNDLVYRNLALADRNLGLLAEARDAARKAVELDRFDPANQALLAEFTTTP